MDGVFISSKVFNNEVIGTKDMNVVDEIGIANVSFFE